MQAGRAHGLRQKAAHRGGHAALQLLVGAGGAGAPHIEAVPPMTQPVCGRCPGVGGTPAAGPARRGALHLCLGLLGCALYRLDCPVVRQAIRCSDTRRSVIAIATMMEMRKKVTFPAC